MIYLDQATARLHPCVANIVTGLLGPRRLPMLLLDCPDIIQDRTSSRGAAILGMLNFGRDHCYALKTDLSVDQTAVGQSAPAPGFGPLPLRLHLPRLVALTSSRPGYWTCRPPDPRRRLEKTTGCRGLGALLPADSQRTGLRRIHDYYGMVEQVGSIFLACDRGHLHPVVRTSWSATRRPGPSSHPVDPVYSRC